MNPRIGINSPQITDFGGAINPGEVEIIELGLDIMEKVVRVAAEIGAISLGEKMSQLEYS